MKRGDSEKRDVSVFSAVGALPATAKELGVAPPADEAVLLVMLSELAAADAGAAESGLKKERLAKTFCGLCLVLVR